MCTHRWWRCVLSESLSDPQIGIMCERRRSTRGDSFSNRSYFIGKETNKTDTCDQKQYNTSPAVVLFIWRGFLYSPRHHTSREDNTGPKTDRFLPGLADCRDRTAARDARNEISGLPTITVVIYSITYITD